MHSNVIDELELHLDGRASASFYLHLQGCEDCRNEVEALSCLSESFAALKADADSAPQPGDAFYSRVVTRINGRQPRSVWNLFSLSQPIFRRLAFASLMILAGLGSYLVSQESSYLGADAAEIIAQHRDADVPETAAPPSENSAAIAVEPVDNVRIPVHNRDYMLVTLANYRH